jgi:heme/copper-type cytochrome/quinol oxidase subunit 2
MLNFFNFNFFSFCDAPERWHMGLQDPATASAEAMLSFYDYLLSITIAVGIYIILILFICFFLFYFNFGNNDSDSNDNREFFFFNNTTHASNLEFIWTILPAFVLLLIAVPSFSLLYSLDGSTTPKLAMKIIGRQWYWSYETTVPLTLDKNQSLNFISFKKDSYIFDKDTLTEKLSEYNCYLPRLLQTDVSFQVPKNTNICILVTSSDVVHSWSVPAFGIKVDACPGRLSQSSIELKRAGLFYGQCSEICGVNHGFMPIQARVISDQEFFQKICKAILK